MKILFAADGSEHTQKALEFIVIHQELLDAQAQSLVK